MIALVGVLLAACASAPDAGRASTKPSLSPTAPRTTPVRPSAGALPAAAFEPADGASMNTQPPLRSCRAGACHGERMIQMADGSAVRLWSVPGFSARPVLELFDHGQPMGWMVLRRGQSLGSTMTCASRSPQQNCVIVAPLGVHSGVAQLVLVGDRRLADSSAFVVADTPSIVAADLNGDGFLDVAARDSDYLPNFAQGHLFDRTYRFDAQSGQFVSTGCTGRLADPRTAAAPSALQTGPCPPG